MSTKRKKPSRSPLRDALNRKQTLRTWFDLAVATPDEIDRVQRRLEAARQMVVATLLHDDEDVRERAERALEQAQAERDKCFHRIWFRSIGLTELDALSAEHPPTDAQREDGWAWNPETFNYALLAAAVVDGDLNADDWAEELSDEDKWPAPDRRSLINSCLAAQRQTMADAVPKD